MECLSAVDVVTQGFSTRNCRRGSFIRRKLIKLLYSYGTFSRGNNTDFGDCVSIIIREEFVSVVEQKRRGGTVPSSDVIPVSSINRSVRSSTGAPRRLLVYERRLSRLLLQLRDILSGSRCSILVLCNGNLDCGRVTRELSMARGTISGTLRETEGGIRNNLGIN